MDYPERFGKLLTEGIYKIKSMPQNLPIKEIEERLAEAVGSSRHAIDFWRRGHVPSEPKKVKDLAQEIVRWGKLDLKWLRDFLKSADYPAYSDLCRELFPIDFAEKLAQEKVGQLLERGYQTLIGRDSYVEEIIDVLHQKKAPWLVTIDGMGGIGKTTLALNVAVELKKGGTFAKVVWISAARRIDSYNTLPQHNALTFDSILTAIGHELGDKDIPKLQGKEKEQKVKALLKEQPILIVLDNLETAVDPLDSIMSQLNSFLNPSKALLTSRVRFKGESYAIHLEGISNEDAIIFMRQDALLKRNKSVENLSLEILENIASATGGSPLALQLVVGQLVQFAEDIVLYHLRKAVPLEKIKEDDEYEKFYKHIFMRSWGLLDDDDEQLLMTMAIYEPNEGADYDMLKEHSGLGQSGLKASINSLWRYSFLEISENSGTQKHYYLHPLTQYFVLSDMLKIKPKQVGV